MLDAAAVGELLQDERRVGDGDVLEVVVARLERVDDRLDRLDVADDVVGGDVGERIGDVVREVVALAQRLGNVTRLRPPAEREQRECRRIASDRRFGGRGADAQRPRRQLLDGGVVVREQ